VGDSGGDCIVLYFVILLPVKVVSFYPMVSWLI